MTMPLNNFLRYSISCVMGFFILLDPLMLSAQDIEVFDRPSAGNDNWTTGPEIGERIPGFSGIDQNGKTRTFEDIKGPNGAYVVFHRSADWWPFCKTQLVELEQSYDELTEQGLGVVAISYDSQEILNSFSERQGGIRYAMLADKESSIIRDFDLLNPNTEPGSMQYGMAFPGIYLVDADGVVQEKFFNQSHRQRITAESVLMKVYGVGEGGKQRIEADVKPQFNLVAHPSQDTVSGGQKILLVADFNMYDKVHLYAPGSSYRAVDIKIDENPALLAGELILPEPEMVTLEAIGETVPVYHGNVRIRREVTVSPHYQGDTINITANLEYQTCDDELCYPPDRMPLNFELEMVGHDRIRAPEGVRHPGGMGGAPPPPRQ